MEVKDTFCHRPRQTSICLPYIHFNPFSAGTAFMLMQTGWIQASRRVTRRLAWDPTCLLLSPSFPIQNKQNLKVLKSGQQYNLFLENNPAFKGLKTVVMTFANNLVPDEAPQNVEASSEIQIFWHSYILSAKFCMEIMTFANKTWKRVKLSVLPLLSTVDHFCIT